MITKSKLHQLEKRFTKTRVGKGYIVWHNVDEGGRLVDKDGYIMTNNEVEFIRKSDRVERENGGTVFCEILTYRAKLKPGSATIPYNKDLHKECFSASS
jgi:hypothetical protein